MNLILKLVRIVFYTGLPLLILSHGAVLKTVYTPLFFGTTVLTILCIIYWFLGKELPVFPGKIIIPAIILVSIVILQILSTVIACSVSGYSFLNMHRLFFPFTADIYSTLRSLSKATSYFCLIFCFLTAFHSHRQKYNFLFFFCCVGFVISFLTIIKMILQQYDIFDIPYYTRGFGPYINRNHYAGYMNMVIPACWALIAMSRERAKKILGLFFTIFTSASLFLSLSRGGILSFFVSGFLTMLVVYRTKDGSFKKINMVPFAGLFCMFLLLWWIGIDPVLRRLSTVLHFPDEPSFILRLWWSLDSFELIKEFPFFGTGLGTCKYVFGSFKTDAYQYLVDHLHNDYMQFIVECGIAGFCIVLLYVFYYIKTLLMRIKNHPSGENRRYLWIAGFSTIIALGVHSLVDFNLHIPANSICFLLMISLPFDLTSYTAVKTRRISATTVLFFVLVIIQIAGTIISIDMVRYEQSVNNALRYSDFVFKHEKLHDIVNDKTCYAKGYYELGKTQFYRGIHRNNAALITSSINNFEKAIRIEPRNAKYYLRIGVARYVAADQLKDDSASGTLANRALSDLHHAVRLERTNGMLWYFYGSYLIKNWYDFWDRSDDQLRDGINALSAGVSFRPSYLPGAFEKLLQIDNNYATLYRLIQTISSIKMLPAERLKRLSMVHSLFSRQIHTHQIRINFGTCSKSDLRFSNETIETAENALKQKKYRKALLLYEKVTKQPSSGENKVKAHAGIAACLSMLQLK